eukprot:scaffold70523_cov38-Phaeocystis_antarctica.AAC.1
MPARIDYDNEEEHERDHAAWRKKNVRGQVTQQRHAASQEKKVGLVNDWMERQGYPPFVEWLQEDEALPESGWELHLIFDVKRQKGSKKDVRVPRVPNATSLVEWAFAYSTGRAPKGGSPEYRAGPWYSLINGKTQAEILMPEDKRKKKSPPGLWIPGRDSLSGSGWRWAHSVCHSGPRTPGSGLSPRITSCLGSGLRTLDYPSDTSDYVPPPPEKGPK